MSSTKRKRVYRQVATAAQEVGHEVRLDDRPVKTPAGSKLLLPNSALAEALAAEWDAQKEEIIPDNMPLTALTCTAIDLVEPRREAVIDELADYTGTDLICYRADRPPDLVARQEDVWQPLVAWAATQFKATLVVTDSLLPCAQPVEALSALRAAVAAHEPMALSALATAVKSSGSLVIGLALSHRELDPAGAFDAAELHESYQIELWGEDAEATRRRAVVRKDLEAAHRLMTLLKQ